MSSILIISSFSLASPVKYFKLLFNEHFKRHFKCRPALYNHFETANYVQFYNGKVYINIATKDYVQCMWLFQ